MYKNDNEFKAKARANKLKAEKPIKSTYFSQRLKQKHHEAMYFETQKRIKKEIEERKAAEML